MNVRQALRSTFLASSVLILSCQDQKSVIAPEAGSAPVAFRFAAPDGRVPVVDIVQVDVDVFRDSAYQPFEQRRYAWTDSAASLQVPLHTPLRLRIQGILRPDNREIVAWTASRLDTLDGLSAEANVITFGLNLLDTDPPDVTLGLPSPGANLIVLDSAAGKLELNIPSGDASGTISFPTTQAESLYVNGAVQAPVDGAWTLPLGLGSSTLIQLVGTNKSVASWTISVGSRDRLGLEFTLAVDNGASRSIRGDSTIFTLPYVVDSTPSLDIRLDDARDRPRAILLDGKDLDTSRSSWSVVLPVPEAGSQDLSWILESRDSVGNVGSRLVVLRRSTAAGAPELSWSTDPRDEAWGTRTARFVLKVVGGDSLLIPAFTSSGLGTAACDSLPLQRAGDTVWWQGSVPLLEKDSGSIVASVSNKLGTSWSLPEARIRRFDPAGPDVSAPSLQVDPLPVDGWTRTTSTTLRGKAFDARSSKVLLLVQRASGAKDTAVWSSVDSSWSFLLRHPQDVDTTIAVIAVDTAGNASTPTPVRVRRDTRKPDFAWSTVPAISADTLKTNRPLQTLSVDASSPDVRGAWAVRASTTDTLPFTSVVAGTWTVDAPLPQGWSTWTVGVSDSAGNDSLRILRVLRDTIAPTVAWSVSGTNAQGKYAIAPVRDTLWISSDTTITLALSSTTGFAGVAVPAPSVDSAGTSVGSRSSLVLKPAAGSATAWTLKATDELGNTARPVKLVVVGLTATAAPVAKFGSSIVAAEAIEALPWPKTAHMTCPSGTTLNIGTGATKDSVIWTTTNLSLFCNGPKIRSSVAAYTWTIQDTASIALASVPSIDSLLAVAVDENGVPWVFGNYGGYHRVHRFSTDTTAWSLAYSNWSNDPVQQVFRAAGFDASNRRYFGYYNSKREIAWFPANIPSNNMLEIATIGEYLTGGNAIQGNAVRANSFYQLNSGYQVTRNALAAPYALQQTYERSIAPITNSQKPQIALTKDSIIALYLIQGMRGNTLNVGTMSGSVATERFQLDAGYQRASIAGSLYDNTFAIAVVNGGRLSVFKYSSALNSNPYQANVDAGTVPGSGIPLNTELGKSDLWINASGTGVYRLEADVSQVRFWALAGVQKSVSLNQWDGAWSIVKVGSGYRLYHFKGSRQ